MQFLASIKGMNEFLSRVRTAIQSLLIPLKNHSAHAPLTYFFDAPGKMLRPMLIFSSHGLLSKPSSPDSYRNLVTLAAGLELLHSASLIHDDILDQSPLRRGQTALHAKFPPKMALLCGDLLYSMALARLKDILSKPELELLFDTTTVMCLAEIQALSPLPDVKTYLKNLEDKTARLFQAACKLTGSLSGASIEEIEALGDLGLGFGLLYQLLDDYQDQDNPFIGKINLEQKISELTQNMLDSLHFFAPGENREIISRFMLNLGHTMLKGQP